jgi:hypothetical protein
MRRRENELLKHSKSRCIIIENLEKLLDAFSQQLRLLTIQIINTYRRPFFILILETIEVRINQKVGEQNIGSIMTRRF